MPLNMNTVGTGTGICNGEAGSLYGGQSDFVYQMFPNGSGINISSISGFDQHCASISDTTTYPPMFKLNGDWYSWIWDRGNPNYYAKINKITHKYDPSKELYNRFAITMTSVNLSGSWPYVAEQIIVHNGYAYFLTTTANDSSIYIYRTDIKSGSSTKVYSSPYMNYYVHTIDWFPMNSDGSRICIRTRYNPYSSSDYTYYQPSFLIVNIQPTGAIETEKLVRINTSYRIDLVSAEDPKSYMTYGDMYFNENTCIVLYSDTVANKYKLTYINQGDVNNPYLYNMTVTLVNTYNITVNKNISGIRKFHNSYPSAPFYTNKIVVVQNGSWLLSIYQIVLSGEDLSFKQIFAAPYNGITNNPLDTTSTDGAYITFITDYEPPIICCRGDRGYLYANQVICDKTYADAGYARYIGYCKSGDTICTDTGIMKISDPSGSTKSYGRSTKQIKVATSGKYTIDVYAPDSLSKPPCVIIDQNGCMFNTYLVIDENDNASACLLSGTTVNSTFKATSGVNDISEYYKKDMRIALKK